MKNKKLLLIEIAVFSIALGYVMATTPGIKLGLVIMFYSLGMIIMSLVDNIFNQDRNERD